MPTTSASDRRARGAACLALALALAALLSACGDRQEASSAAPGEPGGSHAPGAPSAAPATAAGSATPSASPSATPPSTFGERQLDHPDDLQMLMLAYRLEGREPPIATWAGQQSRVAYADEFQRPHDRIQMLHITSLAQAFGIIERSVITNVRHERTERDPDTHAT